MAREWPRGCRMVGDRDVDDPSALMREDHQYEQEAARGRRHDEEIGRGDLVKSKETRTEIIGTSVSGADLNINRCNKYGISGRYTVHLTQPGRPVFGERGEIRDLRTDCHARARASACPLRSPAAALIVGSPQAMPS